MKTRIAFATLSMLMLSDVAIAQENPFAPKQQSGLTRAQIEQIARQEYEAQEAQRQQQSPESPPVGAPVAPGTEGIPSQPGANGAPGGSPVAGAAGAAGVTAVVEAEDPVAALISDGGSFVGCVRSVPIFRDSVGRRIYFTTKELKNSEATKRYARC